MSVARHINFAKNPQAPSCLAGSPLCLQAAVQTLAQGKYSVSVN